MKITPAQVEQIGELARLELGKDEKVMYADQLSVVLDYVEKLNEIDTSGIPETTQVTGLDDVFRDDVSVECDSETKKKLIDCFPEKLGNLLKVKAIFNNDEE